MSSIIKGLARSSVLIILTTDDVNVTKEFLASLENKEEYSIELVSLKNVDKQLYAHIKVYDVGIIEEVK